MKHATLAAAALAVVLLGGCAPSGSAPAPTVTVEDCDAGDLREGDADCYGVQPYGSGKSTPKPAGATSWRPPPSPTPTTTCKKKRKNKCIVTGTSR